MEDRKRGPSLTWLSRLYFDEQGQATTEYILMLSIVVSLLLGVIKTFIKPTFAKLLASIEKNVQNQLFGANLHTFRVRR